MNVTAKSITKRSLFKLYLNTFGLGLFVFTIIMGVFSFFGGETITWNNENYTGLSGMLISIPLGLFLALWFTLFLWLIGILGMWINSMLYGLNISFRDVQNEYTSSDEDESPKQTRVLPTKEESDVRSPWQEHDNKKD
jgi:hypothetical protein